VGAIVIEFPGDETFNHSDKVVVWWVNFWPKCLYFRWSLTGT